MQSHNKMVKPIAVQPGIFGSLTKAIVIINMAGVISLMLYWFLGVTGDSSQGMLLDVFLLVSLSLALISFVTFYYLYIAEWNLTRTNDNNEKTLLLFILLWAVIFRIVGIWFSPIYEDDFYRYLWDAYHHTTYGSPYGIAPSHYFGNSSIPEYLQSVLDGINNPDIPTIYGPSFQYSFLIAYQLFPGDVFGLQLFYSVVDVGLILLLSKIVRPVYLILYAWCPLVVKEIAFTAHPDGLGVFFLIASFFALRRSFNSIAVILLAFSVCAKIFAVLFVPFVLLRCQVRHALLFSVVVVLLYLPFVLIGGSDFAGLAAFANEWQFNGSLFPLLVYWLPNTISPNAIKAACILAFSVFYFSYLWHFYKQKNTVWPRGDWIMGAFFIIAPVVNAWYLIWLLAFAVMYPSRWAWTASMVLFFSYITGVSLDGSNLDLYQQPLWARVLQYGLILIALIIDVYKRDSGHRTAFHD